MYMYSNFSLGDSKHCRSHLRLDLQVELRGSASSHTHTYALTHSHYNKVQCDGEHSENQTCSSRIMVKGFTEHAPR